VTSTEREAGDGASPVAAFLAKWRAREPEMAFAEVFCPRPQRERFALWGALLFEWREAALELSDPRPTQAKCAWWADEALRSAQSAPRHPLTRALAAPQLPWQELARGLSRMAEDDASRAMDRDGAVAAVAPLAEAMAQLEGVLFAASRSAAVVQAIAVHLLAERLHNGLSAPDGGRIPLSLLARHGVQARELSTPQGEAVARDWAGELAAALPDALPEAALYRRARMAFDGLRLRRRATGRALPISSLRALLLAWRSARRGHIA
jgi:hypothetical protein